MEDFVFDYYERPRMRVTQKVIDLITEANDNIRAIAEDLVTSAILLNHVKPKISFAGIVPEIELSIKTKNSLNNLRNSLYTMESLAFLDDNYEGELFLIYTDHVKESLTEAISFVK